MLPAWAQEGGAAGTLQALGSRTDSRRIAHDIAHGLPGWENILGTLGPESIEIANAAAPNEDTVGLTLEEIAGRRGCDPVAAALELYVDTGTYADPARTPDGVVGVWVAGRRVWKDGAPTGERPGGVVR